MAYSNKVLDHYENPRNVGKLDDDDENVGTGMVGAPACGDVMRLQIKVDTNGIIEEAMFKTYGCGSAIASSSLLTEWVKGKTLKEATAIKNMDIVEKIISEDDISGAEACNKGIDYATGDIIGFLYADDYLVDNALHEISQAAAENPNYNIYSFGLSIEKLDSLLSK